MQINIKKYILPYVMIGLYATKLGQMWRLAPGADFSAKVLGLMDGFAAAFQSAAPSFHPADLLVGLLVFFLGSSGVGSGGFHLLADFLDGSGQLFHG